MDMAVQLVEEIDYPRAGLIFKKLCNDPDGRILNSEEILFFEALARRGYMHGHPTTERLAFAMCSLFAASKGAIDQAEYWKYLAGI